MSEQAVEVRGLRVRRGDLTVRQNLRYFARLLGAPRGDVDRALEQVGLTAQADRLVGSLSGGQENRCLLYTSPSPRD